jgi:uncharacterized protein YjiS (DUF1127 family)
MAIELECHASRQGVLQRLVRFVRWANGCARRWSQRISLGELDDHQLRDIGLTRREAEREAARPFWDRSERQQSRD